MIILDSIMYLIWMIISKLHFNSILSLENGLGHLYFIIIDKLQVYNSFWVKDWKNFKI